MIRLAIFDMDGTLADTSPGIFGCIHYAQEKMHLPEITKEQMLSHIGPPMEESFYRNFGLTGEKLKEAIRYYKEYAVMKGFRELTIYPGIPELLQTLKSKGFILAVATLKAQETAEKILQECCLRKLFDVVIGTDTNKPMTKADMILQCMRQCLCSHTEVVMVGDSIHDAKAAQLADFEFVAVTYGFGFHTTDEAKGAGCAYACNSVKELSDVLLNL